MWPICHISCALSSRYRKNNPYFSGFRLFRLIDRLHRPSDSDPRIAFQNNGFYLLSRNVRTAGMRPTARLPFQAKVDIQRFASHARQFGIHVFHACNPCYKFNNIYLYHAFHALSSRECIFLSFLIFTFAEAANLSALP